MDSFAHTSKPARAQNARVKRTKAALYESLASLMLEKNVNAITVRELTSRANINRATFYIHYKDIDDMICQVRKEILDDFSVVLNTHHTEVSGERPHSMLCDMFRFLERHASICKAFLGTHGDAEFISLLRNKLLDKCVTDWAKLFPSHPIAYVPEYFSVFVVTGCIGLFEHWIDTGMHQTPEEMAYMADQMFRNGIRFLQMPTPPSF